MLRRKGNNKLSLGNMKKGTQRNIGKREVEPNKPRRGTWIEHACPEGGLTADHHELCVLVECTPLLGGSGPQCIPWGCLLQFFCYSRMI